MNSMKIHPFLRAALFFSLTVSLTSTSPLLAAPSCSSEAHSSPSKKTARLSPTDARLTTLEKLLFEYANKERTQEGLPRLTLDSALSEVARAHSAEMRDKDYFSHESPTPTLRQPLDRYRLGIGTTPRLIAENIFRAWGGQREVNSSAALQAHNSLMKSPGHRANILRNGPTQIGIGFAANSKGDLWVTQLFTRP